MTTIITVQTSESVTTMKSLSNALKSVFHMSVYHTMMSDVQFTVYDMHAASSVYR